MSKKEKIALLSYILFMTAFIVAFINNDNAGEALWLFFAGIAAYQFISHE